MTIANVEAEAALLGALLVESKLIDSVANVLVGSDFYEPIHGRIFEVIVNQASLGKPTNPVALKTHFEDGFLNPLGGPSYLARLSGDLQGLFDPMGLAQQVNDLSQRRRMQAGLITAANACADMESTTAEIASHADAALSDKTDNSVEIISIGKCFDNLVDSFGRERHGVTCGHIPSLDGLLGPMLPKQLIIGAGRPGMGKTALALSYAIGAADAGHGVLYVSLEMSGAELVVRAASAMSFDGNSGIPYNFIRDDDLSDWQRRRLAEIGILSHNLPLEIADTGSLSIGRLNMLIRRHARRMEAKGFKLELVIVDYLQLLHPDTKGRGQYEAVSEISRGLKAMAKDHGVAIFALAQLSRAVETRPDKRPQLSDLRDSGQIEQDADAVLFLLRPEYYLNQDKPQDETAPDYPKWVSDMAEIKGVIEFILAKRRNGETGTSIGEFLGAYQVVRG